MRSLGNRLDTVVRLLSAYGPFRCLADIGSDHAFVASAAKLSGKAERVVASDLRKGPLERGRQNAALLGAEVGFVLSDGLDALTGYDFDCICVCGMGGELIADILARGGDKTKDCLLILQPMTAQDDLRKFLWENGYTIDRELYTVERGKPYAVLAAKMTGEKTAYSYPDLFLGKERPEEPAFFAYAEKTLSQAKKRRTGALARSESTADEDALIAEADELLQRQRA